MEPPLALPLKSSTAATTSIKSRSQHSKIHKRHVQLLSLLWLPPGGCLILHILHQVPHFVVTQLGAKSALRLSFQLAGRSAQTINTCSSREACAHTLGLLV